MNAVKQQTFRECSPYRCYPLKWECSTPVKGISPRRLFTAFMALLLNIYFYSVGTLSAIIVSHLLPR